MQDSMIRKCIAGSVLPVLISMSACTPADPPPPDPATVEAVTIEAMELQASLAGHRALVGNVEAGALLIRRHIERPDPAVNEANVARIMCVGQAGLAKHGGQLEAAVERLRTGLAELDEFTSARLVPIADAASALRERMANAQLEAGNYAALLTGGECTGKETLPGRETRPAPKELHTGSGEQFHNRFLLSFLAQKRPGCFPDPHNFCSAIDLCDLI